MRRAEPEEEGRLKDRAASSDAAVSCHAEIDLCLYRCHCLSMHLYPASLRAMMDLALALHPDFPFPVVEETCCLSHQLRWAL